MSRDPISEALASLRNELPAGLLAGVGPIHVAHARGRADLLGGDVAFAGSTAVAWPLVAGVTVAVRELEARELRLRSSGRHERGQDDEVRIVLDELLGLDPPVLRQRLSGDGRTAWSSRAVLAILRAFERAGRPPVGLAVDLRSDLAEESGLAASTALVAATLQAALAWLDRAPSPEELADEVAALEAAMPGHARAIDAAAICLAPAGRCASFLAQPCELLTMAPPPADVTAVALDLGSRPLDAVVDLHVAAAMAYRIIAARMGLTIRTRERGEPQEVEDPFYEGWLANCDPVTFANEFREVLPKEQRGEEFLDQHGGLADAAVRVDPGRLYRVRETAGFVLSENYRACAFVDDLFRSSPEGRSAGPRLGASMTQSDRDSRSLLLADPDGSRLVDSLLRRGEGRGVYGARATTRGAVVAVIESGEESTRALHEAIAEWERSCGRAAHLFPGAVGDGDPVPTGTFTP